METRVASGSGIVSCGEMNRNCIHLAPRASRARHARRAALLNSMAKRQFRRERAIQKATSFESTTTQPHAMQRRSVLGQRIISPPQCYFEQDNVGDFT